MLVKQEEEYLVRGSSLDSKLDLRVQLSEKITLASKKQLKCPSYVFRPPPRLELCAALLERRRGQQEVSLRMEPVCLLPVFR